MSFRTFTLALAATLFILPVAAQAQGTQSEGYKFLEAVRSEKGNDIVEMLNKPGTTVINARSVTSGESALHIVVQNGNAEYLSFLLSRGANPNVRDNDGNTPLLLAAGKGRTDLVEKLLAGKANVNLGNASRETALIRAVQRRDLQMVQTLLTAGADADQVDLSGTSARDYAKRDGRSPAIIKAIDEAPKKPKAAVAGPKF
ncbi:ankyrin repeat domain-containing protein [Sphingomonas endolithica]|uniref:ankyrin repeat domain-containing protein n=1 Tax=Sphingomonas endolithica TaxID=2972485 RepID=UPI0021AEE95F|nr:ankyrin repeat domain-containing protein [Sphingomonas sp. ZFBP2030]